MLPYFDNSKYIRIGGRPLLLVYRPDLIKLPQEVAEAWREMSHKQGLHLCWVLSYNNAVPPVFPCYPGFDAGVEFPHWVRSAKSVLEGSRYGSMANDFLERTYSFPIYRTVQVCRGDRSQYEKWLSRVNTPLVFVHCWEDLLYEERSVRGATAE
jgi:hypothetical protein